MERAAGSQDYSAPVITVSHPDILKVRHSAISISLFIFVHYFLYICIYNVDQIHGTDTASYGSILTEKGPKALAITYKCLLLSEEVLYSITQLHIPLKFF